MEELQWFDASLWMNEVMRTYNGGTPHSLLGGGRGAITSYISLMGHGVGLLSFPFGSPTRATEVHFTQQQLGQLLGSDLECSASLLGSAAIEKLAFEVQPEAGWVRTMVPVQEMMLGGVGLSPAGTGVLLWSSSGADLGPDSKVMLQDIDLNHRSSSCLHDHVKSLRVGNLGQG